MKMLNEAFRLLVIITVSPAIGFGSLMFLDATRIATPQSMDKGVFLVIGFAAAVATAFWLFRVWPSAYSSTSQNVSSTPGSSGERG